MRKHPFVIFMAVVTVLVASALLFIQSKRFAQVVKEIAAHHLPKDLGIDGDFSELSVRLFPPGIALKNPRVTLLARNVVNLPAGSSINADELDLNFRLFQMFSGNIRIQEVKVVKGEINFIIDPKWVESQESQNSKESRAESKKKDAQSHLFFKSDFHWDELLQVKAESVSVEDTRVHLRSPPGTAGVALDFTARKLRLSQWTGAGGLGYELLVDLSDLQGDYVKDLPLPKSLNYIRAHGRVNRLGANLETLEVSASGVEAKGSGSFSGNIFNSKKLSFEANLKLDGDLEKALELVDRLPKDPKKRPSGNYQFTGDLRGNFEHLKESLKADGNLEIQNFNLDRFHADLIQAQGAYAGNSQLGEVTLKHAKISSQEIERKGGNQPGGGGVVEVGATHFELNGASAISIPLTFSRIHPHWLGAPVLKDVYPLDFRMNGTLLATYSPPINNKPWSVTANIKADAQGFQLDNQRLGETNPMHRLLKIQTVHVEGPFSIDPKQLKFNTMKVAVGQRTQLTVLGKVDFKTGFDMTGEGPVDFSEIHELAENEIRGVGTLKAHVHGPSSAVVMDFDPDVQDAYYIRMKYGALKGRLSWIDDVNHLIFTNVNVLKGSTPYLGNGLIDFGPTGSPSSKEKIALNISIPNGRIQDMMSVFEEMTQTISWLPRGLTGQVGGDVVVSGGLKMDQLKVSSRLKGSEWEYMGERFKSVNLVGGYDSGKYYISEGHALKRQGTLVGSISYDAQENMVWDLKSQDFTLTDLDHFARLDVPIRGSLSVRSSGHGLMGRLDSSSEIDLNHMVVRGVSLPDSKLTIKSDKGILHADAVALGGQGQFDLTYDFAPGARNQLHANLKHLDFSLMVLLLNPTLIQDPALTAFLSGTLQLNFVTGKAEYASGTMNLDEYLLAKSGVKFSLVEPVRLKITDGNFDLKRMGLRGNQGETDLALQNRNNRLEGSINGDVDLALVEFFTPVLSRCSGVVDLDYSISGFLKAPVLAGRSYLDGASFLVPGVDSPFENVAGSLQLKQGLITAQNITADLAGGRVTLDGTAEVFTDRVPDLNLKGSISGSKLKVFPFQFVKVHGSLRVHGDELPYLVEGNIVVESAFSKEKVIQQKQSEGLKAVRYTPPVNKAASGSSIFKLNVDASADRGVLVQNDLFNAEFSGHLKLVNTLEAPRIVGTADLVQGKMNFKDREFQIQSASAKFDNPTVINPLINMTATTEVNGTKIQLFATGRLDTLKVDFTSNPVLPESEIISLLAFGLSSSDASKLKASDRSVLEQSEAASLLLHSFDFNREVQDKTGIQIQLDESINNQIGTSIFRPNSQADSAAAPKIIIRRSLGPNAELSYGSTVGVGTESQKEVNAEYHLTPGFSVIGVWDNYEALDIQQEEQTSYGLDLKLQKRFK